MDSPLVMHNVISRRSALQWIGASALLAGSPVRAEPSAGALKDDIVLVRRVLALHPGLLRYQSTADVERRLARLARDYVGAAGLEGRFLALSAFMATIRCGHSHCNPFNQRASVAKLLFDRPSRLPFEFDWVGASMVVLADRGTGRSLPAGTVILSIDDEEPERLLARLLPFARADGANDAKRVAQMAMRGTERYEAFDIFQGLIKPPEGGRFRLRYRRPDRHEEEAVVPALTAADRLASRKTLETDGTAEPFWNWEMRGEVAVLTMPSWVMYNSNWKWEPWLDDRLDSLAGARGLIIDLRDNEGGNECGNSILARLASRDLRLDAYRQRVRFRRTPSDLDPILDTWDESFRRIGEGAAETPDGFFELGSEATDYIPARGRRLDLPVAALVGPVCSSATFSFARRAKESGLIRLFGEESGGNMRGINGNGYFFVRLPGSGLEFDLPIVGNFASKWQPDRGVIPDMLIRPGIADIAAGRDACLIAAEAWILSRRETGPIHAMG